MIRSKSILLATASVLFNVTASHQVHGMTETVSLNFNPQEALLGYYNFDKDAHDQSGHIEPIDGLAIKEILKGKHGGAIRFDGNTILEIPIDLSADLHPEFTVSMWVKADPMPTDKEALKKRAGYMHVASDLLSVYGTKSETPYFYAPVPGAKSSNSQHRVRPGQWAHIAVTRKIEDRPDSKGKNLPHVVTRIYSGGRMTEKIGLLNNNKHQPSIYLGGHSAKGQAATNFVGLIDDLQVYKKAISEAQIGLLKSSRTTANNDQMVTNEVGTVYKGGIEGVTKSPTDAIKDVIDGDEPKIPTDAIKTAKGTSGTTEDDLDIPLPSSLGQVPESVEFSKGEAIDALEEVAKKAGTTLTPLGGIKETVEKLPAGDVSAENPGTPPLVPRGLGGAPTSIETSPSDENTAPSTDKSVDVAPVGGGGLAQGPLPGQAPTTTTVEQPTKELSEEDATTISQLKAKKDWKITGLELASAAEEKKLRSGDRIRLKATTARFDSANKLPKATLSITAVPASGGPAVVETKALAQKGDGSRINTHVLLQVPTLGADGKPLSTTNMIVTAKINYADDLQGIDEDPSNNVVQSSFVINKNEETEAPTETQTSNKCEQGTRENADGTRTAQGCLESKEEGGIQYYVDPKGLLVHTDIPVTVPDGGKKSSSGTDHRKIFNAPIFNLALYENNDKPCRLDISIKRSEEDVSTHFPHRIKVCSFGLDELVVGARKNRAITGLRICRNAANRRVKGIEIQTRPIYSDGTLGVNTFIERGRRTNCSKWTEWRYCPGNFVAAGVVAYARDGSSLAPQRYINTVNLICGELQIRKK